MTETTDLVESMVTQRGEMQQIYFKIGESVGRIRAIYGILLALIAKSRRGDGNEMAA